MKGQDQTCKISAVVVFEDFMVYHLTIKIAADSVLSLLFSNAFQCNPSCATQGDHLGQLLVRRRIGALSQQTLEVSSCGN